MQRYFVNKINNEIVFNDSDVHHILHVMRMKSGEQVEVVLDGQLFCATIETTNPLKVYLSYEIPSDSEISRDVTLFYALAKGDKIDLVVQKATELGAKRIVLMSTERCVVKWEEKEISKKLERYKKIIKEASEQSHRLLIPEILGVYSLNNLPKELLMDTNFFAYEKEAGNTTSFFEELNKTSGKVSILVGPEGGFSSKEAELVINQYGFIPVSLGKRILRSETAAIYALSVIGFMLEK
ncbi:MAG: 16S rRNA (uracil(1498)-N(3))-methyltransferase [Bacilli bacterium]|nr:16S rRNA (uracil(1498)-N(3))-methyltransferase [Bacilli bacterium]